jgi:hypothetical protein
MGTGASAAVVAWPLWGGRAFPRAAKTYATEWGVFVLEQPGPWASLTTARGDARPYVDAKVRPREGTLHGFDFDETRRMVYERDEPANHLC